MISKNTVFILGAGANVPYGFSSGAKLLEKARALSIDEIFAKIDNQLVRSQVMPLKEALTDNLLSSIDAMLEHRQDLWPAGKKLMASLLYEEEAATQIAEYDEDWMSLIFEYM